MRVSKKKLLLFKHIETLGKVLFGVTAVIYILACMTRLVNNHLVWAGLMIVELAVWMLGTNLLVGMYVCPSCGRKLLVSRVGHYRVARDELPAYCETCGWKVTIEME